VIEANVEWLRAEMKRRNFDAEEALADVTSACTRLGVMLQEALEASRGELKEHTPIATRVGTVVDHAANEMRRVAAARGVRLEATVDGDRALMLDEPVIERLLQNLLDNALRYTETGGEVTLHASANANQAIFTVSDDGPGIAMEHAHDVFKEFYSTERGDAKHHGLGLAFCKAAARAHGGDIEVTHNERGGATFIVTLPIVAPPRPLSIIPGGRSP
jgi:signal transduction histidine kinase